MFSIYYYLMGLVVAIETVGHKVLGWIPRSSNVVFHQEIVWSNSGIHLCAWVVGNKFAPILFPSTFTQYCRSVGAFQNCPLLVVLWLAPYQMRLKHYWGNVGVLFDTYHTDVKLLCIRNALLTSSSHLHDRKLYHKREGSGLSNCNLPMMLTINALL